MKNWNNKTKFISLQTKYEINDKELVPHHFKEAIKTNRNAFNKTNNNKKDIKSVTEADNDDSSSNKKSKDNESNSDKRSESNRSGSENDDKDSGNGSGSASGSGSGSGGSD